MRYEVTIVATNFVLVDADNEDEARQKALELGVFETLDGADYDVTSVFPDPYNEEANDLADLQGSMLAFVFIGLSALFFLCYTWLRCWVVSQFSREALQQLAARTKLDRAQTASERHSSATPINATMSQRLVNVG